MKITILILAAFAALATAFPAVDVAGDAVAETDNSEAPVLAARSPYWPYPNLRPGPQRWSVVGGNPP